MILPVPTYQHSQQLSWKRPQLRCDIVQLMQTRAQTLCQKETLCWWRWWSHTRLGHPLAWSWMQSYLVSHPSCSWLVCATQHLGLAQSSSACLVQMMDLRPSQQMNKAFPRPCVMCAMMGAQAALSQQRTRLLPSPLARQVQAAALVV